MLRNALSELRSDAGQRAALEYLRVLEFDELLFFLLFGLSFLNFFYAVLDILQSQ